MAKIVVVEAGSDARDYLGAPSTCRHRRLFEVLDGADALERVREENPDLVIANIMMPTMDGHGFMRRLRADPSIAQTSVIVCSADLGPAARKPATTGDTSRVRMQPYEPKLLIERVASALEPATSERRTKAASSLGQAQLRSLADKLSQTADALRLANQRLKKAADVSVQIARESDTDRLLRTLCDAARKLTGANYASLIMWDERGSEGARQYVVASGMDIETGGELADISQLSPNGDGSRSQSIESRPCRVSNLRGDLEDLTVPSWLPLTNCLLAIPIASEHRNHGWLYLTDKLGEDEFSEADEQLMSVLAAQAASIYEKQQLHADALRNATALAQEIEGCKQAEMQMRRLNEEHKQRSSRRTAELEAANQELDAFSHSVSHDLRAPLCAINGFATILLQEFSGELSADAHVCIARIQDNAERMDLLIRDLLAFSRLTQQPLSKQALAPADIVGDIAEELLRAHADRTIVVNVEAIPRCRADHSLLQQVFINLLSNAFKFTRYRDVARIDVGCIPQKGELVVFVKDNGAGFDMQHAGHLFGVFQRLHRAEDFEGTGVGLSLVRRIINRHGGRVWADAKLDAGATFYFSLPATVEDSG
ncbi:MAG: ATP-binding protein [Betaproteobacteria bacterium]